MGKRSGVCAAIAVAAGVVLLSVACSSLAPDPVPITIDPDQGLVGRCPKDSYPCGNGCMPINAACCDDGTRHTSSYCTNSAGGGCHLNADRTCTAPGPSGTLDPKGPSAFCCAANSGFSSRPEGSFDCADGTHHCGGTSCVPIGQACCAPGASTADCPAAAHSSTCPSVSGVPCAVTADLCGHCDLGNCCASDPTKKNGYKCLAATGVCTGIQGTGSGSSGSSGTSSGCKLVWDCGALSSPGAVTMCTSNYGQKSGSAAEPDKATCDMVCKSQGACTCQGC